MAELSVGGHDVVHIKEQGLHRLVDSEILLKAARERRVVVTADHDFADILALLGAHRTSVVIIEERALGPRATLARRILDVLESTAAALELGAIVMVEPSRHRVRPLPIEPPHPRE